MKVVPVPCFLGASQDPNPEQRSPSLAPKTRFMNEQAESKLHSRVGGSCHSRKARVWKDNSVGDRATAESQTHGQALPALNKPQPSPVLEPNGERMHAGAIFLRRRFTFLSTLVLTFLTNEESSLCVVTAPTAPQSET